MTECCKKKKKIIRENAFEQKKEKPELKFNPGLALIGLRTTGSVGTYMAPDGYDRLMHCNFQGVIITPLVGLI